MTHSKVKRWRSRVIDSSESDGTAVSKKRTRRVPSASQYSVDVNELGERRIVIDEAEMMPSNLATLVGTSRIEATSVWTSLLGHIDRLESDRRTPDQMDTCDWRRGAWKMNNTYITMLPDRSVWTNNLLNETEVDHWISCRHLESVVRPVNEHVLRRPGFYTFLPFSFSLILFLLDDKATNDVNTLCESTRERIKC